MDEQDILDPFDGFDADARIVTLRYFHRAAEGHLYAARLRDAGIPCFVSNVNTMTTLPLGGGGIGLQVRETDAPEATLLIDRLDRQVRQAPAEGSYHDADHEDIEYLRQLHDPEARTPNRLFFVVLAIALLLILRAFLRASGIVENSWDPF